MATTTYDNETNPSRPAAMSEVKGLPPAEKKKASKAKVVLPVLVLGAAAVGGFTYVRGMGKESTDDAQIEGHVLNVAARVSGQVSRVLVKDNQLVNEGDPLVEIDPRDLQARLLGARADLAQAKAQLNAAQTQLALTERNIDATLKQARGTVEQASAGIVSSKASIDQSRADIQAAESRRALAEIELKRTQALTANGSLAQAELDSKQALYDQAAANVVQAKARLAAAQAGVSGSVGGVVAAEGRLSAAKTGPEQVAAAKANVDVAAAHVEQATAALQVAELNASYVVVKAPAKGVVSRRTVEIGQTVGPDRPLMALVPPDDVWVVANFKEDQMAEMNPGQAVKIRIDTYGGREFDGHVDSLASASGARFALLPPDNASGNFTKVVQRIPVLIRLNAPPALPLRPGMSAYVTVFTKH